MPKYAPADEHGLFPFVVRVTSWGRSHYVIQHARTRNDAEYGAKCRMQHTSARALRAQVEDIHSAVPGGHFPADYVPVGFPPVVRCWPCVMTYAADQPIPERIEWSEET